LNIRTRNGILQRRYGSIPPLALPNLNYEIGNFYVSDF